MPPNNEIENSESMDSLPGIRKLTQDKVNLYLQKPKSTPKKHFTHSTEQSFQSTEIGNSVPESISESWFHHGMQLKLQRKIRMGKLPVDAILDLHGFSQREAVTALQTLLKDSIQTRARFLLIVHGKGYRSKKQAVIRPMVHFWLSEQSAVLAYCPSLAKDGGSGASYVYLRTKT